jgi:hypothetical protein
MTSVEKVAKRQGLSIQTVNEIDWQGTVQQLTACETLRHLWFQLHPIPANALGFGSVQHHYRPGLVSNMISVEKVAKRQGLSIQTQNCRRTSTGE